MSIAFCLIAQSDSLSGGAGWAGAGLLGLVLAWLLFVHLPAKDKQLKEFTEGKDKHVTELTVTYENKLEVAIKAFKEESKEDKAEFKMALDAVLAHCEKETKELVEAFRSEMNKLFKGERQS